MFRILSEPAASPLLPTATRADPAGVPALGLLPLAAILWHHRRAILVSALAALAATLLFILVVPERFTAVTQLMIEPRDLRVFDKSVTEPSAVNDTAAAKVESQVRVLASAKVLQRVVEHDGLVADTEFNGRRSLLRFGLFDSLGQATAGPAEQKAQAGQALSATTLDNFKRRVAVNLVPRTFVVEVAVTTREREKSMRLADGIVQAYLEEQALARFSAARKTASALTARLADLREAVEEAERKVEEFRRAHGIVAANGQFVNENQAAEVASQLTAAEAKSAEKKARYDQVRQLQRAGLELGALTEAVQSSTVAQLRSQYAAVARRESELAASLGPRHPRVIEARAELARARALVAAEIDRLALTARNEYEQAKANEEALRRALDELKATLLRTREDFVRLRELERDALAKRNVYETSAVRARELNEQEWVDTTNARVISAAEYPRNRSFPPGNLLLLALGLFLGVSAGSGYALLREMTGPRPRLRI